MPKNHKIFERESPKRAEPGTLERAREELFLEALEGLDDEIQSLGSHTGLSTDIRDYGWNGGFHYDGERRLTEEEVDLYLNADLEPRSGLEQVLLSIIDKHEVSDKRPKKPGQKAHRILRLEQAMKHLTGQDAPKGPDVRSITEDDLLSIACGYRRAVNEIDPPDEFIERLIYLVLQGSVDDDMKQGEISDFVRYPKKRFYEDFQRLMFKAAREEREKPTVGTSKIEAAIRTVCEVLSEASLPKMAFRSTDE